MSLKPFFYYFGGKYRIAPRYPEPKHETIVEPFAGAAGYSVRYADRKVVLIEKSPKIAAIWRYLIGTPADEIMRLPVKVAHTKDIPDPAAGWLIGLWLNKGAAEPHLQPSKWVRDGWRPKSSWGPEIRERIASQVEHIRHWEILEADWWAAADIEATWFIDPPYHASGNRYPFNQVDYTALGIWCRSRSGQTIVCEQQGADWLPFKPFHDAQGCTGKTGARRTQEVIWTA